MNLEDRRQLGAFLKARRAQLHPEDVGLPRGVRRRAQGLRREEVAQLAGVSVTWYTWIEQGRAVALSPAVLDSIVRVLRLSAQEQLYVATLAGRHAEARRTPGSGELPASLQELLDHQAPYPAYVLGRYWDILAWNRPAVGLFGDFASIPAAERNMVWYTCARLETRALVVNWAERARRVVAEFRADCSGYMADPVLVALLERLRGASSEFAQWWAQHEVLGRDGGRRAFQHPLVGHLVLDQLTFCLSNDPNIKLVVHLPSAGEASEAQLRQLVDVFAAPQKGTIDG